MIRAQCDLDVVAAQRVAVRELDIMRIEMPAIAWVLIVLDNYFTVKIVHRTPMPFCESTFECRNKLISDGYRRLLRSARNDISAKQFLDLINPTHQQVHFFFGVVKIEAGTGGRGEPEFLMQRLGAVMAGANGDPVLIQDLRYIMRMD